MKLQIAIKGVAVATKMNENKKNPESPYFNVVIESNDEADTFSCTKEVFEAIQKYQVHDFIGVYDTKYKYFRIESAKVCNK